VLKNCPLQALLKSYALEILLIIKLYQKIILQEGVRKGLCVKIMCIVKVMMKIYPLKTYAQKVICIIIFISYSCTIIKIKVLGKSCA